MEGLKSFLAGFSGFLIVLCLPLLALAFSLNNTLLNEKYVGDFIKDLDFVLLPDDTMRKFLPDDLPGGTNEIVEKELSRLIREKSPGVIEDFYLFVKGKKESFNTTIDLYEMKERIKTEVFTYLEKNYGNDETRQRLLKREFESLWSAGSSKIPDKLEILDLLKTPGEEVDWFLKIREGYRIYNYLWIGGLIFIVLAIAAVIFLKGKFKKIFITLGVVFLISGILTFGFYNVSWFLAQTERLVDSGLKLPEVNLTQAITFIMGFFNQVRNIAIACGAGGIAMIIVGNVVKIKPREEADENLE